MLMRPCFIRNSCYNLHFLHVSVLTCIYDLRAAPKRARAEGGARRRMRLRRSVSRGVQNRGFGSKVSDLRGDLDAWTSGEHVFGR